ncbi:MAG: DUF5671 domain-containing protein [Chloroflexota bacterium]
MSTIRRLYFYGVAFAALMVAAEGAAAMLGAVIDRLLPNRLLVGDLTTPISLGLALMIPSVPLWLIHWRATQRYVARGQEDVGSTARKLYLNAVLFISAAVAFGAALGTLQALLGSQDAPLSGAPLGVLLVWGSVWSYHWRLEGADGQPSPASKTLRRWYVYITSGYSLTVMVIGLNIVLSVLLTGVYRAIAHPIVLGGSGQAWSQPMKMGVSMAIVGGLWWSFHWLYAVRRDRESVLRQVYLYLFAVLGGIVTVLSVLGMGIYQTLRFVLGGVSVPAAAHFQFLATTVPPLLVGVGLWAYHWRVVREEGEGMPWRLLGAGRAYRYVMAGLGLGSLSAGIGTLVYVLLGFLDSLRPQHFLYVGSWWQGPTSAAVAMLVVGMPVWWYYWTAAQVSAIRGGTQERAVLPRRIFLYLVLAASLLGILVSLSFLLYQLLSNIIRGTLSLDVLRESRWSIGVVVSAGFFLAYYWGILREDQMAGAEIASRRKKVLVLVGDGAAGIVPRLEEVLGVRPKVLRNLASDQAPVSLSDEQMRELAEQVAAAPGSQVMLVVSEGVVKVYPYRE